MRTWVRSVALLRELRIGCMQRGCGVGSQLQLQFDPLPWELPYAEGLALKKKKKKKSADVEDQIQLISSYVQSCTC